MDAWTLQDPAKILAAALLLAGCTRHQYRRSGPGIGRGSFLFFPFFELGCQSMASNVSIKRKFSVVRRDRRGSHVGRCSRRSHGPNHGQNKSRARRVVTTLRGQVMDKVEKKAEAGHGSRPCWARDKVSENGGILSILVKRTLKWPIVWGQN